MMQQRTPTPVVLLRQIRGSYGAKYKSVLMGTDTPGNLHSICSDNYAGPFEQLKQVVIETSLSTFVLNNFNAATDRIESIAITRGGIAVSFAPSDWTLTDKTIQFNPGILQTGDVVTFVMAKQ